MEVGEATTTVRVEENCAAEAADALRASFMAPTVVPRHSEYLGHAQAIWCERHDVTDAGSDPRADGSALVA
jgi:gamma-glutamyltranspeptidase